MTRRQPEEERGASDYATQLASYDPVYSLYPTLRQRSMRPRMMRHAGLRRFVPNPPYHLRSSSAHASPRL